MGAGPAGAFPWDAARAMTIEVKICGIRTAEALDAAIAAGADYFGLVFYGASPRAVDRSGARQLVERAAGRIRAVALLVDPQDGELSAVLNEVQPDLVQLHGSETPERVAVVRTLAGRPVIKAIPVAGAADLVKSRAYAAADLVLFDAKPPPGPTVLPGGNGIPFDWGILAGAAALPSRFILSGGLDPETVAEAIRRTGAAIVDVSSGVERAPGDKDPERIRRFVAAAKSLEPVA